MTTELAVRNAGAAGAVARIIEVGDWGKLSAEQRVEGIRYLCDELGISPLVQPFDLIPAGQGGKLTLYANRRAAAALAHRNGISVHTVSTETIGGNYVVSVRATDAAGREFDEVGAVCLEGLGGQKVGNAIMHAQTKATRRAILGISGLGLLDETEAPADPPPIIVDPATGEVKDRPALKPPPAAPRNRENAGPRMADSVKHRRLRDDLKRAADELGHDNNRLYAIVRQKTGKSIDDLTTDELQAQVDEAQAVVGKQRAAQAIAASEQEQAAPEGSALAQEASEDVRNGQRVEDAFGDAQVPVGAPQGADNEEVQS